MESEHTYQLSVIVVNYNVEHFLHQCLDSVKQASKRVSVEIIVVDNCSVDGSLEMLNNYFPDVQLIANKDNVGFSRANNQAIRVCKGKYVLLLNPDTVVAEDTFEKVVQFMDENEDCGGLGVHMIDGKGHFLPESKRGLPTPRVAFYKIFGLSSVFPKSRRFGQYHQGHLPEFEINEIDVLSGAFMLMRKSALDKVGLLDEDYFMYGEDIDLSYRIKLGGYKNYYFPETSIIHYKGESTKKSSVNYVLVFYKAMVIFARKHFSGKNAGMLSFLINTAIYLRAFMALFSRFVKRIFLPLVDAAYIVGGLYALTNQWKMANIDFPAEVINKAIPIYALTWILVTFVNGGYDFPVKLFKHIKGTVLATLIILVGYAILPKELQFSRLFIFAGAGWTLMYFFVSRIFMHFAFGGRFRLFRKRKRSFTIQAKEEEFERIKQLLTQTQTAIGTVTNHLPGEDLSSTDGEVIYSSKDLSYGEIISSMKKLGVFETDFKIAPESMNVLIGSNSIDTAGDLYILNLNALNSQENRRKKRIFDLTNSVLILLASPILVWSYKKRSLFYKNILSVFTGRKSFIGYSDKEMKTDVRLPQIKEGILSPADAIDGADHALREKLNLLYARDYSMRKDFSILFKSWRTLDR